MSEWRKDTSPRPGSDAAASLGCSCPVLDNRRGEGMMARGAGMVFWINGDCPLHGFAAHAALPQAATTPASDLERTRKKPPDFSEGLGDLSRG